MTSWVEDLPERASKTMLTYQEGSCKTEGPSSKSDEVLVNQYKNPLKPPKTYFFTFIALMGPVYSK